MAEKTKKTIHIALDDMPRGDENNDYGMNERYSKTLPEGVTSGMLYRDVVNIGWPAFMELMLMQLVGMFDQIQVGTLGPYAISAVGISNLPMFLLMTAIMALNTGTMALVARARGRGDQDGANRILNQGVLMNAIVGIVMFSVAMTFARPLIGIMGSDDPQTVEAAIIYFRWRRLGMLPMAFTSVFTSAFRAVGNSRITLVYNTIANVVNVFLNYCLISGHLGFPRLEIAGAAIATVIGQTIAFLIAFVVIDYITGVFAAIYTKQLSSEVGFKGIAKKVMIFLLVAIGNIIDIEILKTGAILRTAVIFFYLSNEGISIIENAARLDLPIPARLADVLKQIKDGDEHDKTSG